MGPRKGSKKQPPARGGGGGNELLGSPGDSDAENAEWSQQTEQEKRKVRRSLRELYEKLSKNREKYAAGGDSEDIASIIKEANDVLRDVKGTQEAMEDAKMFKLLCQTVREMSEDTNTNEKKFHLDEFAMLLGNRMNARREEGGQVHVTRRQLVTFGEQISRKFNRAPTLTFISEAINTEAPDSKPKEKKTKRVQNERDKIVTKTVIHEKNQVTEQKTDRLVNSTRKILENIYKQGGKKPVGYFEFVIDPESFGNTVENMFHVSFLVKQRVVCLTVDDEVGLPFLEPVSGGRGGGEEEVVKNQAVISISYQDWQEMKDALEISEAAIVHPEDLRHK